MKQHKQNTTHQYIKMCFNKTCPQSNIRRMKLNISPYKQQLNVCFQLSSSFIIFAVNPYNPAYANQLPVLR